MNVEGCSVERRSSTQQPAGVRQLVARVGNPSGLRRTVMVLLALLVAGGTLVPATPAGAATYPSTMSRNGGWRECTNTALAGCAGRGTIASGTSVKMHCWIDDSWATGAYRSNRWFYVTSSTGVRGFVHSSVVGRQTAVSDCKSHNGIAPARWAAMQVGEKRPSATEASRLGIYDNMWSGWCQAFAGGAYRMTGYGSLSGYGSAAGTYREYKRRGLVQTNMAASSISIGALVYYSTNLAGGFGHVAVYVGNGYVVSTQGVDDPTKPVARLKLSTWGNPIGWVMPAHVDGA